MVKIEETQNFGEVDREQVGGLERGGLAKPQTTLIKEQLESQKHGREDVP